MRARDPLKAASGHRLDESDPDVLVLRRRDGSSVAAFSAAAFEDAILLAARRDRRAGPAVPTHKGA